MILKGAQRGGAKQLAGHLLKAQENEHVEVYEVKGFVSDDLHEAFNEVYAVSQGTRCRQFLFSLSLNPPQSESAPVEYFEKALADIEKDLGLEGQPRAIVFHEKEGRRHAHCVWSRINTEEMKAINLPYYKYKLRDISKQLYLQYGWELPKGFMDREERNPLNFTLAQWQQAKRLQEDPKVLKKLFQECWAVSDSKTTLEQALKENGLYLARGDRRGYVAIDFRGEVFSLNRWANVKTKELKQRLGSPDSLPSIDEVKAYLAKRMTDRLQTYIHQTQDQLKQNLQPFIRKKRALQKHHRHDRQRLKAKHEERWKQESLQRSQRLPKGLKGIWHRITGKYQKIRSENELETKQCRIRDRDEKQRLIERQLKERQTLQRQAHPMIQEHKLQVLQLKQDVAGYIEMGGPSQKTLQEEFGHVRKDRDRDHTPEM